jgi:hypothetical protein
MTRAEHRRGDDHSAQLSTHYEVKRDTSTAVHAGLPQIDDRAPSGRQENPRGVPSQWRARVQPSYQTAAPHLLVVSRRCSSSGTCQSAAGGPDRLGRGCWLRAGGMGVLAPRRWAGPRRKGTSSGQGPVAQARHAGVGYSHRDASLDGPPAMAGRPVRPCFPCPDGSGDAVRACAARGGWRCSGSPAKPRSRCPAGAPGRAVAHAKDRRWLSPGRSRMGSPAAAAAAEPLR